jgi:uncharacterized PurR-regulated membrane protein YhhQ (DUF165 family)
MIYAIGLYAASIVAANLLVAHFGPAIMWAVALVLIGLDLALRDWLHIRLRPWQMGALIGVTGLLTYLLNPAAQHIAVASAVAFAVAAAADWLVFVRLPGTWFRRSAGSNVAGAAVDSVLFPLLAFGPAGLVYAPAQFAAKAVGGALWAGLLSRRAA